ncbi:MAG: sugar phosphate isomerase/epimerase [Proteobacteria bacterium]|nr:sugar phosphate isomerase/epimerase [Pseudomonadota bacterium]
MLGVSTSLRSEVTNSGVEVIDAVLDLGVEAVELEYRITSSMLQEILPLCRQRQIAVVSLHNFFPVPEKVPKEKASGDVFSLSALDKEERDLAIKYTLRTLEWAEELEVQAVVLHLGKIPMDNPMETLRRLYDQKKIPTEAAQEFIREQRKIRAAKGQRHLDAAQRSLERLARQAEKRDVLIGLENRSNIQDVPNLEEFKVLFQEFTGSPVRYWHDVGHAATQQNLGLENQEELLKNCGDLLVGIHLHGCKGYNDHEAPGSGEEDYTLIKKYLKPETIRVMETHHRATRKELLQGLQFLKEHGITGEDPKARG